MGGPCEERRNRDEPCLAQIQQEDLPPICPPRAQKRNLLRVPFNHDVGRHDQVIEDDPQHHHKKHRERDAPEQVPRLEIRQRPVESGHRAVACKPGAEMIVCPVEAEPRQAGAVGVDACRVDEQPPRIVRLHAGKEAPHAPEERLFRHVHGDEVVLARRFYVPLQVPPPEAGLRVDGPHDACDPRHRVDGHVFPVGHGHQPVAYGEALPLRRPLQHHHWYLREADRLLVGVHLDADGLGPAALDQRNVLVEQRLVEEESAQPGIDAVLLVADNVLRRGVHRRAAAPDVVHEERRALQASSRALDEPLDVPRDGEVDLALDGPVRRLARRREARYQVHVELVPCLTLERAVETELADGIAVDRRAREDRRGDDGAGEQWREQPPAVPGAPGREPRDAEERAHQMSLPSRSVRHACVFA